MGLDVEKEVLHVSDEDVERFLSIPYEPVDYDVSDFSEKEKIVGDRGVMLPGLTDPAFSAASLFSFADFTVWAMRLWATEPFSNTPISANVEATRRRT